MKTKFKNCNEEDFEEFDDELELELDEEIEEDEEILDEYEKGSNKLLKEVNELPNGEDRSRAIKDLEVMSRIANDRKKLRNENRKIKKELALREEEVDNVKRNGVLNTIVNIGGTIVSFVAYGILLGRQNRFESGETYTTSGSRNLVNSINRIIKRS